MGIIWRCDNHAGKPHYHAGGRNTAAGYCPQCHAKERKAKIMRRAFWKWITKAFRWGRA